MNEISRKVMDAVYDLGQAAEREWKEHRQQMPDQYGKPTEFNHLYKKMPALVREALLSTGLLEMSLAPDGNPYTRLTNRGKNLFTLLKALVPEHPPIPSELNYDSARDTRREPEKT